MLKAIKVWADLERLEIDLEFLKKYCTVISLK